MKDHPSYSQFVASAPEYQHLNRMVDVLELHKLLAAGDGRRCDEHLDDMLAADPTGGQQPRMIARIEERAGRALTYGPSPATKWPHSFAILSDMARRWDRSAFVAGLMGPSGAQLPLGERYGVSQPHVDEPQLAARFASDELVQLDGPFRPEVLAELARQVAAAPFAAMRHSSLGVDYTMDAPVTQAMLHYLVGDTRLIALVERLAGIPAGAVERFSGRIYKMIPSRDGDSFHSDVHRVDKRLVAISVSLEPQAPRGGELVLRRKGFLRPFTASRPAALGGLVLFRISRFLEHKVARVYAGARTNLAGWYCPAASFDYSGWVDRPLFPGDELPRWRLLPRQLLARR